MNKEITHLARLLNGKLEVMRGLPGELRVRIRDRRVIDAPSLMRWQVAASGSPTAEAVFYVGDGDMIEFLAKVREVVDVDHIRTLKEELDELRGRVEALEEKANYRAGDEEW